VLPFLFAGDQLRRLQEFPACGSLDSWLCFGCRGVQENVAGPVLMDGLVQMMQCSGDTACFRDWFLTQVAALGMHDVEWMVDTVVAWLQFAHVGHLSYATPFWWVLAWAGCPFQASIMQRCDDDTRFVHQWLDKSTTCSAFREWMVTVVPELEGLGSVCDRVLTWVRCTAAEVLPCKEWYVGLGRADSFAKLGTLLRRHVADDIASMTLQDLLTAETIIGARLPWDLRRILFQMGDKGMRLFFGMGVWRKRVCGFSDGLEDGKPRKWKRHNHLEKLLEGFLHLGHGGGGMSSSLELALRGTCRCEGLAVDKFGSATITTIVRATLCASRTKSRCGRGCAGLPCLPLCGWLSLLYV